MKNCFLIESKSNIEISIRSRNNCFFFIIENEVIKVSRYKNGNPKRQSRFICLCCMRENMLVTGIQRKQQREKEHIKDLFCLHCSCITKNIEVRYCDSYDEIYEFAKKKRENYYTELQKYGTKKMERRIMG